MTRKRSTCSEIYSSQAGRNICIDAVNNDVKVGTKKTIGLIETSLNSGLRVYEGKVDKAGREFILHF